MKNFYFLLLSSLLYIQVAGVDCNNLFAFLSHNGNYIYFSSDRHNPGGNYEIYRSDIDGVSNLVRLTYTSKNNYYPIESQDGARIVWQQGEYGTGAEIWIMNSDGTGQTQLTSNNVHDGYPNFSPDGQTIVFEAWDTDDYPEIFTMDVAGNNRTQLTNESGAYWQSAPIYNPSGTYIYFLKGYNADNHLARMDLDGSNQVDITSVNTFGISEGNMRFSPDGQKIIFITTEYVGYNNGSDIVIADTTGNNWNKITNSTGGAYYYWPVWHPDGHIYYSHKTTTSSWSIYRMTSGGGTNTLLSNCYNVGIENVYSIPLQVYPNPTNDGLFINYNGPAEVELFDARGRSVLKTGEKQISLAPYEPGYYVLILKETNSNKVGRVKIVRY